MEPPPAGFLDKAHQIAARLQSWKRDRPILILGHRDGDGLSAASVLYQGLCALGFQKISTKIILSPNSELVKEILTRNSYDYVIAGDIGAGFEDLFKELVTDFIIADHHPNETGVYGRHQLNPCEFHMNDEICCSGSTTAALILLYVFPQDFWTTGTGKVILCYAIAGAVSDFQMKDAPVSLNKDIIDLAVNVGAISMRKDICLFGRGMYPVFTALNRSGIPGFDDLEVCKSLTSNLFELKKDEIWTRIIDLTQEEKQKLVGAITIHLLSNEHLDINTSEIINGIVNYVYDLEGLQGWACTVLPDGRRTVDAREILHRVNYVSRRGKAELALELLNNPVIENELWNTIESFHSTGDREIAQALELYESGKIPIETWDERIVMADFTGTIFYDEVGVIAGVLMKKFPNIEIMLSYCDIEEDDTVKLSTRARDDVWKLIEMPSRKLSDAKQVYEIIRKNHPTQIMQFGGHRWACSGFLTREIVPEFFKEMLSYHQTLKDPSTLAPEIAKSEKEEPEKSAKTEIKIKKGQTKLDQYI